jgi:regulator of protease activity HflC (stomatin/prohibitin superfamily)
MSSEPRNPNATWHSPNDLSWDSDVDVPQMPPLEDNEDEEEMYLPQGVPPELKETPDPDVDADRDTGIDVDRGAIASSSSRTLEVFQQIARQLFPLLIPLLLGGLSFLLTLPWVLSNRAYLHQNFLLPIALVFLAIMVAQGWLLFITGSNAPTWWLHIVWGTAGFLLVSFIVIFGPATSFFLFLGLLIIGIVLLWQYFHSVPDGRADIVYSFGKYRRTLFPGPNFLLPWEKVEHQLSTLETQWLCPLQRVPISRNEDVQLAVTVSYKLMPEDSHLVLGISDWKATLEEYFLATIQSVANELKPEDLIDPTLNLLSRRTASGNPISSDLALLEDSSTRWDRVNDRLQLCIQDKVARWGVHINSVHVRDITFLPRVSVPTDTDSLMLDVGATRGKASTSTPQLTAQVRPRQAETGTPEKTEKPQPATSSAVPASTPAAAPASAQPAQPSPTSAASAAATPISSKRINEEMMRAMYDAVRDGHIKDPLTIRNLALRFEAIANDHEISKDVDFNAAHAAQQLYRRAGILEAQAKVSANQTTMQ